ncbi:MAG: hypothetical protein ABH823_03795 [bacterium]
MSGGPAGRVGPAGGAMVAVLGGVVKKVAVPQTSVLGNPTVMIGLVGAHLDKIGAYFADPANRAGSWFNVDDVELNLDLLDQAKGIELQSRAEVGELHDVLGELRGSLTGEEKNVNLFASEFLNPLDQLVASLMEALD